MATFTFLPENPYGPLYKAQAGTDAFTVQELYSDWMDWLQADPANQGQPRLFDAPEGNKNLAPRSPLSSTSS